MRRFFSPLLFLGAGIFVLWSNAANKTRVLTLPFIDSIYPAAQGDLALQGRITGILFVSIGAVMLLRALWLKSMDTETPRR